MPSRFKSRQQALQILFLWDVRRIPIADALTDFYGSLSSEEGTPIVERDTFADELAAGAAAAAGGIDEMIVRFSEHWRIERMPVVDRNILRLAVHEMKTLATPSAVSIDQALELARRFSSEESLGFLNGVLDAINRELHPEHL